MKKHKFACTDVEIHHDGSATIHHTHESGDPDQDVHHAVADLDGMHDSMEKHLNPEEEEEDAKHEALEEKVHPGIHEEIEKLEGEE